MQLSDLAENTIIDCIMRGGAYTPVSTYYFALLTSSTGIRQNLTDYEFGDTMHVLCNDGRMHLYKCTVAGTSLADQVGFEGLPNETVIDGFGLTAATFVEQSDGLDDTSEIQEFAFTGSYARAEIPSDLDSWSGTQGSGTTEVSIGVTRSISNNVEIVWPQATGVWGQVWGAAMYTEATDGTMVIWGGFGGHTEISTGDEFKIAASNCVFRLMGCYTVYLANKLLDWMFRGQAFTFPTSVFIGLVQTEPTAILPGEEIPNDDYARVEMPCNGGTWAGTQAPGSTTASVGTSSTISNNETIMFPTPTTNWGDLIAVEIFDAIDGGNRLLWGMLAAPKTVFIGDSIGALAGEFEIIFDSPDFVET